MTTKVVAMFKYFGVIALVFFTITSCEKEIENIGVDIIENDKFTNGDFVSEVNTNTENVERVPANGVAQYLLGVYADAEFGELKASIVSQITPPKIGEYYNFGEETTIDSVLLIIPYQSTKEENDDDGNLVYSIDSVYGNEDEEFLLSVYELETFFNTLDPTDPSKNQIYYSDKVFAKSVTPFYSDNFKINANDTVAYIKRYMPDGMTVYDTDTIKELNAAPAIRIPLDKDLISNRLVDNASGSEFSSIEEFIHYFRGLYIEASTAMSNNSHLVSLSMGTSKMVIYFSNTQDEGTEQDFNDNGIKNESNVRVKNSFEYALNTNKSNVFERDLSNSKQSGDNRLYVQGAAGSIATINLNEELEDLQENNWLVNEANLTFYVDQNASSNIAPEQLFIYNYEENEQILDMFSEGLSLIGGTLERDEDGNPYKYVFKITNYISELLKAEPTEEMVTLGIKVYNPSDSPSSFSDTAIREYSWNPQGVVLYNQDPAAGDKRVKLDIYYTEIKN